MGNKIERALTYLGNGVGYFCEVAGIVHLIDYSLNNHDGESFLRGVVFYIGGRIINESMRRIRSCIREESEDESGLEEIVD